MNVADAIHPKLVDYLSENGLDPKVTDYGVFATRYLDVHLLFRHIRDTKYEIDLVHGLIENLGGIEPYKKRKKELLIRTIPLHLLFLILLPFNLYSLLYWIVFIGLFGELVVPYFEYRKTKKMIPEIEQETGLQFTLGDMKTIIYEKK